jgi:hypothetical protein
MGGILNRKATLSARRAIEQTIVSRKVAKIRKDAKTSKTHSIPLARNSKDCHRRA